MIDYTKRAAAPADHVHPVDHLEFRLAWPEVRQKSIIGELRHTLFSSYGGASRAQLYVYSVIIRPGDTEPEAASRRNTPSDDGAVHHTVTSPAPPDTLANAVRSGMPGGSESVRIDVAALPPGTVVVFAAAAGGSFDLAQLGPIDCRLVDAASEQVIEEFVFPHVDQVHNCRVLARLAQNPAGRWGVTPIGTTSVGKTLQEFVSATRRHV